MCRAGETLHRTLHVLRRGLPRYRAALRGKMPGDGGEMGRTGNEGKTERDGDRQKPKALGRQVENLGEHADPDTDGASVQRIR